MERQSWWEISINDRTKLYFAECDSNATLIALSESKDTTIATTKSDARWINTHWWIPSCRGRLTAKMDSLNRTPLEIRKILTHNISITEQNIKDMDSMIAEMDYFFKTHFVQDAGYELVTAKYEYMLAERTRQENLLKTIKSIKMSDSIAVEHKSLHICTYKIDSINIISDTCIFDGKHFATLKHKTPKSARPISFRKTESLKLGEAVILKKDYFPTDTLQNGFGMKLSIEKGVQLGEWKKGKFMGERLSYHANRIYGIDISRYQHEVGKKRYAINWSKLRITSLGKLSKKTIDGTVDYPVSFCYIKVTEGETIKNKYYASDYLQARKHGIKVGSYHFFSTKTSAVKQARWFLRNLKYNHGDLPPVLDIEPSTAQINKMGGPDAMFNAIRTWVRLVEEKTGQKPILYISQTFVNKYLPLAPDLKRDYHVWIARYGEYKPDVHMMFWQLSPDGRVRGIVPEVDINVLNGLEW